MNFSDPVHPPAGRHRAAGARPVSRRRRGLRLPAGVEHADGGIPDHPRLGEPARAPIRASWRRPSRLRSSAGSAKSRASPRSPRQLARQRQHHHPVRPRPQHRRRRARRAGGAQRGADRSARRPADLAGHAQGQSVRCADPDPGADLEDHAGEQYVRCRRQRHRAAHRRRSTALPRSPSTAPSSRRCASGSIRSRSPRWA